MEDLLKKLIIFIFLFHLISVGDEINVSISEEKVKEAMMQLGIAIEKLYIERGLRLVDIFDGNTSEGQQILKESFNNIGNPTDRFRTCKDVFLSLVHFEVYPIVKTNFDFF